MSHHESFLGRCWGQLGLLSHMLLSFVFLSEDSHSWSTRATGPQAVVQCVCAAQGHCCTGTSVCCCHPPGSVHKSSSLQTLLGVRYCLLLVYSEAPGGGGWCAMSPVLWAVVQLSWHQWSLS